MVRLLSPIKRPVSFSTSVDLSSEGWVLTAASQQQMAQTMQWRNLPPESSMARYPQSTLVNY
jgi:hypothetical protein